ncbi:hypothetical protein PFWH6_2899 [Pseudomonas fluorescens WH6]|nr:hypothetical protein PFWH6_2899 [Pseudomonas fluorescens WH6]
MTVTGHGVGALKIAFVRNGKVNFFAPFGGCFASG